VSERRRRRAFDIDAIVCPRCGGRLLRLIATIEDPDAIGAILTALGESGARAERAPPRGSPLNTGPAAAHGA